jgi:hypothetical protein
MMVSVPLGDHERRVILAALRTYAAAPTDEPLVVGLVDSLEGVEQKVRSGTPH